VFEVTSDIAEIVGPSRLRGKARSVDRRPHRANAIPTARSKREFASKIRLRAADKLGGRPFVAYLRPCCERGRVVSLQFLCDIENTCSDFYTNNLRLVNAEDDTWANILVKISSP